MGVITRHDTYVYSTIGLDPLRPVRICSHFFCTNVYFHVCNIHILHIYERSKLRCKH